MEEERVVSAERGRQLAEQLGVEFYETSAKENINVKVSLTSLVPNTFWGGFCDETSEIFYYGFYYGYRIVHHKT